MLIHVPVFADAFYWYEKERSLLLSSFLASSGGGDAYSETLAPEEGPSDSAQAQSKEDGGNGSSKIERHRAPPKCE